MSLFYMCLSRSVSKSTKTYTHISCNGDNMYIQINLSPSPFKHALQKNRPFPTVKSMNSHGHNKRRDKGQRQSCKVWNQSPSSLQEEGRGSSGSWFVIFLTICPSFSLRKLISGESVQIQQHPNHKLDFGSQSHFLELVFLSKFLNYFHSSPALLRHLYTVAGILQLLLLLM